MTLQTFAKVINGQKVRLQCHELLANQAAFLLDLLAEEQARVNILQPGFKLQIGWSLYFIKAATDGFQVTSPNYTANPFEQTTLDLTIALSVQMRQNDMLRETGATATAVSFKDTLIVLNDALTDANTYMVRDETDRAGDSGWYWGLINDRQANRKAEDYTALYVWQLLKIKSVLMSFLALPYGCMAMISDDEIVEIVDSENRRLR